jgi:hypothetical protein
MKRIFALLGAMCVFIVFNPAILARAAEPTSSAADEPSNVTITVVLPGPAEVASSAEAPTPEPSPALTTKIVLYPVDVAETRENGERRVVKTYELSADEDPADIPRDSFERNGWQFSLTDIIRRETANAETREHTETVTLSTDTKELEQILPLLSPTLEFKADDDFAGILSLDVSSIKIETAGTKTSSYTMSVTREYPRLSAADTSLVPKTVTDKGKTYTLESVDWNAGNYVTVDYDTTPEYYTAVATYNATGASTKVTGCVTTAEYTGTLARLARGKTVYTAYFEGEEIRTPLELIAPATQAEASEPSGKPAEQTVPEISAEPAESASEHTRESADAPALKGGVPRSASYIVISLLALMLAGAIYFIIRKGTFSNEKIHNEKAHNRTADAHDGGGDDSSDGDSGSRG